MAIRFHLDVNVSGAIASALRHRGIDLTTTVEALLLGADDRDHLQFAISQRRVIVTHDDDYTRLHAEGFEHAGICYCQRDKYAIGDLIPTLLLVAECLDEDEMRGHLEYL